uniref:cytochrome P450 CYP82D47-like n=1 Tax=Erigeron canadensis TaxID=72917 RepID=UPI001CB94EFD|nr:cytochrome P450 CYP82D47-like [Erigeron canadensis]
MEIHFSSQTTLATTFSIIALIFFLFKILNKNGTKIGKNKTPPQPKGSLPIIGHLHLLARAKLPHRALGSWADALGPIFSIKLGVHRALVVSDPEIAKECFTTHDKVFATRPKSIVVELMGYNYAVFGLGPYGEYWRQVRKMATVELLSQRRVEMLKYIRVPEVRASMKDVYEAWERSKKSDADMVPVEMKQLFANLVLNIVSRSISGNRFSLDDKEAVRVHKVVKKVFQLMGTFMVSDYIPSLNFLDFGGYKKEMKIASKELDSILQGWLDEHKKRRASGEQREGKQDFMDVMLSILEGASKSEFPGFDHDTIVKSTSMVMLAAGLDTTSVTLTWALSLLVKNPKVLKAARDELDFHVGRDRIVEESDINNLVYLQAIVKESLRLYPAAPLSTTHESLEDCVVAGYNIPKGTRLITNLWRLHRDTNVWSNPDEFHPERFLASQKGIDLKGQNFELLPFGSGRRMCPAVSFALPVLHLSLASLIQGFELKPLKEPVDMSEVFVQTVMRASPLEVLVNPRLPIEFYNVDA